MSFRPVEDIVIDKFIDGEGVDMDTITDFDLVSESIRIYMQDKFARSLVVKVFPDKENHKKAKVWLLDKRDNMRRSFEVAHYDGEYDLCMQIAKDLEDTWGKDQYWRKYIPKPTAMGEQFVTALTKKAIAKGYVCEIVTKDIGTVLTLGKSTYLCKDLLEVDRIIEKGRR